MTREEAVEVITKATYVFVYAVTSMRYLDGEGHTETFRMPKNIVLNAMEDIRDTEYEPIIDVSEDGTEVTIGVGWKAQLPANASHFESNNSNADLSPSA